MPAKVSKEEKTSSRNQGLKKVLPPLEVADAEAPVILN